MRSQQLLKIKTQTGTRFQGLRIFLATPLLTYTSTIIKRN
ncbi:hypothetical protein CWATWH0005_2178 [Crocosphaera watsonii WH 0005]|uniref:Uncharacterized protein n=1 Tax=Crocosphaera watsonii WH 0005 TaxID=423472 RepID=T2J281_CROWT|nr:hypothetical protein CWATWH0005_2178 [Crocosphaera watsonii WH 0005]